MNQADASADDKVDIFLSETDYVYKYTDKDADVAMPLTDLGIDPDKDLADQYDFTKTTASDADGVQRGSTWQCCPGLLVYRRDIAKEVFGTDDPTEVGEKVKRLGYNERDCCSTEGERLLHIFFLCRHLPFIWKQHRTVLGTAW